MAQATEPVATELPPEAIALATRMYNAARNGDIELLRQALEHGLPANMTNEKGDTLIMLAAYHGHDTLVRLLLTHNADANRLNDRGQSPLSGAVFKKEPAVIAALLEGGADPEYGAPSALDCVRMFRQEDEWLARFQAAPGRGKMERERNLQGNGIVNGHGTAGANGAGDADGVGNPVLPNPTGEAVVASGQAPSTEQELEEAYRSR